MFIVEEDIMNGTVKIDSIISAIEANNFNEAKVILKNIEAFVFNDIEEDENKMIWRYKGSAASIFGIMKNKELHILNKE